MSIVPAQRAIVQAQMEGKLKVAIDKLKATPNNNLNDQISNAEKQKELVGIKLSTQLDIIIHISVQCSVVLFVISIVIIMFNYMAPESWRWLKIDELKDIKAIIATVFAGYFAGKYNKVINK